MKFRDWIANRLLAFYQNNIHNGLPDWVYQRELEAGINYCSSAPWGRDYDCDHELQHEWDFG